MAKTNPGQVCSVKSPDGKSVITVSSMADGSLGFSLTVDGQNVLRDSRMGYRSQKEGIAGTAWQMGKVTAGKHKGVWKPLWGKRSQVPDVYNEARVSFSRNAESVTYEVRAYNDGVAWRCVNEGVQSVWSEVSNFNFAGDYTAWYYNGERHNIGPEKLTQANGERTPIMVVEASKNLYMAVHEACLQVGRPLLLKSEGGSTRFDVVTENTTLEKGQATAWRVVMHGDTPGELVDSHLIELLNPDPEQDFSWVRPGIHLWDWRIDGAIWGDFHYRMNYESWVRMIDFAAEQGFSALVLDANWYGPEFEKNSDPVTGDKARDVQRIIKYGKEKGVGVWLYINDVAGTNYPIEKTLEQYESWGAAGVKYGFMNGSPTQKNQKTINITQLCAKHHLCVDFHDYPVHPWGQARTYPNALTREYCKAQLDGRDIFQPKTFVTSVFVNMVAGPIDQNNGMFDLRQGRTTRKDNNQEVPSTVCSEAARTFITYSGATVIPDIPEYYKKYPHLLEFLASQKQPWMESHTLDGVIGEYIVMMRQASDGRYLVASATNEEARTVSVDLSFLPKGNYVAKISEDAEGAHYKTNREVMKYREVEVQGGKKVSSLSLSMAPGGGACVIFEKKQK
ncbi:MAG: glycoside hydrolase family 97 protein [Bacteroidaceae bacterium]|nr:glycoside hydrolase family 97 protein [Bacteroidaceae bacterium]